MNDTERPAVAVQEMPSKPKTYLGPSLLLFFLTPPVFFPFFLLNFLYLLAAGKARAINEAYYSGNYWLAGELSKSARLWFIAGCVWSVLVIAFWGGYSGFCRDGGEFLRETL
ncbi:MAG: hypothetical protein IJB00_07975 [Akkermansia sp.]|nr:hypothetical protein [Akkermansia sp.]